MYRMRVAATILLTLAIHSYLESFSQVSYCCADEISPFLSEQQVKLLKWIDQLGLPPVEQLPAFETIPEGSRNPYLTDDNTVFVVSRNGNSARMFDPKLQFLEGEADFESQSDVHPLDQIRHADKILHQAWLMDSIRHERIGNMTVIPESTSRLIFWAWVSWRHREYNLAGQLLRESERLYTTNPLNFTSNDDQNQNEDDEGQPERKMSHEEWVVDFMQTRLYEQLTAQFNGTRVSRNQLLWECIRFLENFPRYRERALIVEVIDQLQTMLTEDEWRRHDTRPFAQLTRSEQIKDLIFQLRDQTWIQNELHDGHASSGHGRKSPAGRLKEYGYDAVPFLIEALCDPRLTRWGESDRIVNRVGDCALDLLAAVTHRSLRGEDWISVSEWNLRGDLVAKYGDWYAGYLQHGEIEVLADGISAGDVDAPDQAKRLAKLDSSRAIEAIWQGLLRVDDVSVYWELIAIVTTIPGEQANQLLVREAADAPQFQCRLKAARSLTERGSDEGLKAMMKEWLGLRRMRDTDSAGDTDSYEPALASFLLTIGRVEAIEVIKARISEDLLAKSMFMKACAEAYVQDNECFADPSSSEESDEEQSEGTPFRDPAEALHGALEKLFVGLLDDDEWIGDVGYAIEFDDPSDASAVFEPRVRDLAALILKRLNPQRYSFTREEFDQNHAQVFDNLKSAGKDATDGEAHVQADSCRPPVLSIAEREQCRMLLHAPLSELEQLIERTRSGDDRFILDATQLAQKYPEMAIPALKEGIIRSKSVWCGTRLVSLIGQVDGPDATAALIELAERSSLIHERVTAALALVDRQHPDGVSLMLREWKGLRHRRATDLGPYQKAYTSFYLLAFLLSCGQTDAIIEVQQRLPELTRQQRIRLLTLFSRTPSDMAYEDDVVNEIESFNTPIEVYSSNASDEWKRRLEQILLTLLDDVGDDEDQSHVLALRWISMDADGETKDSVIRDCQLGDIAALALRNLDNVRFAFTDEEQDADPDQVRLKLKKILSHPSEN